MLEQPQSNSQPTCPECGHWLERTEEIDDDRYALPWPIVAGAVILGCVVAIGYSVASGVMVGGVILLFAGALSQFGRPQWYCFGCRAHWRARRVRGQLKLSKVIERGDGSPD